MCSLGEPWTPAARPATLDSGSRARRRMRAAGLVLGVLIVAALGFVLLWVLTPSVDDLPRRVADRLAGVYSTA